MTDPANIHIHINLDGMSGRTQRLLQAATNFVSIGLNAKNRIQEKDLSLPDVAFQNMFNAQQQWTVDQASEAWEQWMLRNGFRDVAEIIGGVLEEAQTVLSCWALLLAQKECGTLKGDQWNELVMHRGQRFHYKTLPQRIEFLQKTYAFSLPADLIKQILSINAARNCFVHRGGVVGSPDVDEQSDNKLIVEWQSLALLAQEGGEKIEIELPYETKQETSLYVTQKIRRKIFTMNEQLSFNSTEFSQICWTIFSFSLNCAQSLEKYGKEIGFEFTSKTEPKNQVARGD